MQHRCFNLGQDAARLFRVELQDPFVGLLQVKARVSIRQFALAVEGRTHRIVRENNRASAERLLGPLNSPDLGGDLKTRFDELTALDRDRTAEYVATRSKHFRLCREQGIRHPDASAAGKAMKRLEQDIQRIAKDARTLKQAGEQLKALWMRGDDWPGGFAARATAARLALVGHVMGETPLLSCDRGRDCIPFLDPHLKLLAATADCDNGDLPAVESDGACYWQGARSAFANS